MKALSLDVELTWSGTGLQGVGQIQTDDVAPDLSGPESMGGRGVGTNPEGLFVCAVSSCYTATLFAVPRRDQLPVASLAVTARTTVTGFAALLTPVAPRAIPARTDRRRGRAAVVVPRRNAPRSRALAALSRTAQRSPARSSTRRAHSRARATRLRGLSHPAYELGHRGGEVPPTRAAHIDSGVRAQIVDAVRRLDEQDHLGLDELCGCSRHPTPGHRSDVTTDTPSTKTLAQQARDPTGRPPTSRWPTPRDALGRRRCT